MLKNKSSVSALQLVHSNWIGCLNMFSCIVCQDLGSSDLRKDVYIVVHIIRIGRSSDISSLFS